MPTEEDGSSVATVVDDFHLEDDELFEFMDREGLVLEQALPSLLLPRSIGAT
jgi:hypothetical protein